MRKMKTVLSMLTVCLAASSFTGCSSNSGTIGTPDAGKSAVATNPPTRSAAPTKDPVTVTFVIPNTVDAVPFNKIFEAYQKQTGNKVELQALPGGDFDNMMKTRFSTGDFPDLFLMQPGTKQNVKLRAEETLHEWSADTAVWDRIIPSMKEFQTTPDKKIYGVPFGATGMMGVYYNKDVFGKVGVQPPKNYADLIETAKKIKASGVTPFYEGVKDGWPAQIFYLTGWVSGVDPAIGDEGVQKLEKNQLGLADIPQVKDLFAKQKELKDLGLYQDNLMAGTYDEMQSKMGDGKVAMVFMLDGIIPQLEKKFSKDFVKDHIGFFPFPAANDAGTALITPPNQLMVPEKAKHSKEAIDLIKFMVTPDMVNLYYQTAPGIPIFKDAKSELYPVQQTVKGLIDTGKAKINVQNRLTPTFADFQKTLQNFFINGNVDAAVKEFDANYKKDGKSKRLAGFE
ncbi:MULTISPECIES: ABC transporter substrate-binding protein [unclassified Paenibacillus]|uniref:ABC transporter substrate-binding protein n=1 Tax=unclassified Paenibacillus TaxID=185978 RepID=UPI0027859C0A|nr:MULTISPECIES: ABC transporter substrate-binding protein [unclassified Paenibacillus]MDQ0898444.1 raffinose/stachyose/melibiose transport system substrate-binding protein [Paenibacillus sp. V4I7]MDQ0915560.1 raffinose/stachyose/melibiose transport system substrate-binding protein [Paenibacillus sp. V4I5]